MADEGGRYEFTTRYERIHLWQVTAKGYAQQEIEVTPGSEPITVALEPGRTVTGTVLDAHGDAISGAAVFARNGEWDGYPPDPEVMGVAYTDSAGNFTIYDLGSQTYTLDIRASDYTFVHVPVDLSEAKPQAVSLSLHKSGKIEGIVTRDGVPVSGLRLLAVRVSTPREYETEGSAYGETDEQGKYVAANLPAGRYRVALQNRYSEPDLKTAKYVELKDGQTATVNLEL